MSLLAIGLSVLNRAPVAKAFDMLMIELEKHSSPEPQHQDTNFDSRASRKRTAAVCIAMDSFRPDSSSSEKDIGKALGTKSRT